MARKILNGVEVTGDARVSGTLFFGSGSDATLFRLAASEMKTNSYFYSAAIIAAEHGGAANTLIGAVGPGGESGVKLGSAGDTSLYRSAANILATDDLFDASVAGLRTKHESAATPTGGTSGEVRVGTDKLWFQDAGTWKQLPRTKAAATQHGLIAESQDPATLLTTSTLITGGVLYLIRVYVPVAATVTNLLSIVTTAGATLTSGQCLAGLYSISGSTATKLQETATQHTAWQSTGSKTMALTSTQAVTADTDYIVVYLANGTTMPAFRRGDGVAGVNIGLAAPALRYATFGTSQTSLPSTIDIGSATALSVAYFAAMN